MLNCNQRHCHHIKGFAWEALKIWIWAWIILVPADGTHLKMCFNGSDSFVIFASKLLFQSICWNVFLEKLQFRGVLIKVLWWFDMSLLWLSELQLVISWKGWVYKRGVRASYCLGRKEKRLYLSSSGDSWVVADGVCGCFLWDLILFITKINLNII